MVEIKRDVLRRMFAAGNSFSRLGPTGAGWTRPDPTGGTHWGQYIGLSAPGDWAGAVPLGGRSDVVGAFDGQR